MKKVFLALSVLSFLFSAHSTSVFAQAMTVNDAEQVLTITTVPEIPKAEEQISIDVQSYSYDLNSARISWTVNGKKVTEGEGYTHFTLQNGENGITTTVLIGITPRNARYFSRTLTFTPTDVAIIWQANTYTPPLYAGKALFSDQASLTASAVPDFISKGKRIPKENLVYAWSLDGNPLLSKSGYGKHTITVFGDNLGSKQTLSLSVSSTDGTLQGLGSVNIDPQTPKIMFYENHPLFGTLFNVALENTFTMKNTEVSIVGSPYFFSDTDPFNLLQFDWTVNREPASASTNKNVITLRNDSGATGTSLLGLQVVNKENSSQNSQKTLSINISSQ